MTSMNCNLCRFAELRIPGELLDTGEYSCALDGDMTLTNCTMFESDLVNEDFEYDNVS